MNSDKNKSLKHKNSPNIRKVEPEELTLWHDYVESVVPRHVTPNSADEVITFHQIKKLDNLKKPKVAQLKKSQEYLTHGHYPGFGRKNINRIRRGKICLDGQLDLHGMSQLEARRSLNDFIEEAFLNDLHMVLIITGKGFDIKAGRGVLNKGVPRWLNEEPLRLWIKGFGYAAREHGGEGALYVLIRRRR